MSSFANNIWQLFEIFPVLPRETERERERERERNREGKRERERNREGERERERAARERDTDVVSHFDGEQKILHFAVCFFAADHFHLLNPSVPRV